MSKSITQNNHQKRYGQFFSGPRVANLLTALIPEYAEINSAIDPMAGVGDLLKPILSKFETERATAIEIDSPISELCSNNIPNAKVVNADAFSCDDIITPLGWDLVINNPPYVRYQLQDSVDGKIGSSQKIRDNLCKEIIRLQHLSPEDKSFFLKLAQNYSGLSDMAVPSWILSAALVKPGGFLAIIVPDTWLSREYASPIQYMLSKSFDILTIVKDTDASWFENALVRTCLVVAQRRPTLPLSAINGSTLCLDIKSTLSGDNTLVDNLEYNGNRGLTALSELLKIQKNTCGDGFVATIKSINSLFPNMLNVKGVKKWIQPMDLNEVGNSSFHPAEIDSLISTSGRPSSFITINDLNIKCGQGLRTGANEFFYLNLQEQLDDCYLISKKHWQTNNESMSIPKKNVVKALKNRNQIKGLVVSADDLDTGVLYIEDEIRSIDKTKCVPSMHYSIISDVVSDYISDAEQFHDSRGLSFKEYSAVKPNEHKVGELYTRFWYMLPKLSSRHLPLLCLTRINSSHTECLFVSQSNTMSIIVDANFVTIWSNEAHKIKAVFALLNSTWAKCYFETLCTVMGGGALKLEATQLKKIQFPQYSISEFSKLAELGEELIERGHIDDALQQKIDLVTLNPFQKPHELMKKLRILLAKKLSERGAKL